MSDGDVAFNMHTINGNKLVELGNVNGNYSVTASGGIYQLTHNLEWEITFIIIGRNVKLL